MQEYLHTPWVKSQSNDNSNNNVRERRACGNTNAVEIRAQEGAREDSEWRRCNWCEVMRRSMKLMWRDVLIVSCSCHCGDLGRFGASCCHCGDRGLRVASYNATAAGSFGFDLRCASQSDTICKSLYALVRVCGYFLFFRRKKRPVLKACQIPVATTQAACKCGRAAVTLKAKRSERLEHSRNTPEHLYMKHARKTLHFWSSSRAC